MPRTTKKQQTATTEPQITVADAANQLRTTEQALRLALIDIRPDDFDTVKALPLLDFEQVTKKLLAQQQPQFNPVADVVGELPSNPETITLQASQEATQAPQKNPIVPSQSQQLNHNTQSPTPNANLSLIEQLARQAQEEIQAVDAIAQVKNTLILNNLAVRDAELAEGINQRWQGQKQQYLGVIKDLASLAQDRPQFTPDENNLTQEIDSIIDELAKKTVVY